MPENDGGDRFEEDTNEAREVHGVVLLCRAQPQEAEPLW
jgi:hypothetical protein